jgi:hypothetical protein
MDRTRPDVKVTGRTVLPSPSNAAWNVSYQAFVYERLERS